MIKDNMSVIVILHCISCREDCNYDSLTTVNLNRLYILYIRAGYHYSIPFKIVIEPLPSNVSK